MFIYYYYLFKRGLKRTIFVGKIHSYSKSKGTLINKAVTECIKNAF